MKKRGMSLVVSPSRHASTSFQRDFEIAAASWLAGNTPDGDIQVHFDIIDMLVVGTDRALLKHHINAFSCGVK